MKASTFWKTVTMDGSDLLGRLTALLERLGIRYCVIGGQAVNAYAEPLVSLDLDLVVATEQIPQLRDALSSFKVQVFQHSINISLEGSDLRVQIQTDPRYAEFVAHAMPRVVLGRTLMVASVEDLLQGKVWAASDETRRPSKRQKDLADISRLLDAYPDLRDRVPKDILDRLL
jgi:hypothetical protein